MLPYLPNWTQITREALIVLAGTLIAAYVISRFPQLQKFITDNSVTVKIT